MNKNEFDGDSQSDEQEDAKLKFIIEKGNEFRKEAGKDLEPGETKIFTCTICGENAEAGRAKINGHLWAKCEGCGMVTME